MSQISLQHVYKSYNKATYVIEDLNLEIFDDEFLVLVGPSGSGKTTILRMIAGLEELTQGKLYINDALQNEEDPSSRHLSFVFQNYALLPHLTVYENILFGLLNRKLSYLKKKKSVEEIAHKLSIYDKLGSYPAQLSGGQRQRVALARALVDQEKLILFDEPLSNLDATLRSEMRGELIHLQKTFETTCVYVTHDQIEAMAMATRMVLLMEGKVIQVGTPYQMYHDPCHLDVASFIGLPETNVIKITYRENTFYKDDTVIKLSDEMLQLAKDDHMASGYVTIRPQALKVYQNPKPGVIKGELMAVENFGHTKLLHIDALGMTLRVEVSQSFNEVNTLYLDFDCEALLFDSDKKRLRASMDHKIYINTKPRDAKDLQVIRELINYGYEVVFDDEGEQGIQNHQTTTYLITYQNKSWHLTSLQSLLQTLSYRK